MSSFGQKKEMKKATYDNYRNEYTATFKGFYSESDIKEWCTKNGYYLLDTEKGIIYRFGNAEEGIKTAVFITNQEYRERVAYANAENARRQEAAKKRKEEMDVVKGVILSVAAVKTVEIVEKTIEEMKKPSYTTPSSQNNSNNSCKDYTSFYIEIENELEDKRKLKVYGPDQVLVEYSYNDVANITGKYRSGDRECVAGQYSFSYTYNIGQSDEETVSGMFSIDGKSEKYTIVIDYRGKASIRDW